MPPHTTRANSIGGGRYVERLIELSTERATSPDATGWANSAKSGWYPCETSLGTKNLKFPGREQREVAGDFVRLSPDALAV